MSLEAFDSLLKKAIEIGLNPSIATIAVVCIILIPLLWTVYFFLDGVRVKAAEFFLELDDRYQKHIPILLDIEYPLTYKDKILPALDAVRKKEVLDEDMNKTIEDLDRMLRHLLTSYYLCKNFSRFSNARKLISKTYGYYLVIFNDPKLSELRLYIKEYWPGVLNWILEYNRVETKKNRNQNFIKKYLKYSSLIFQKQLFY